MQLKMLALFVIISVSLNGCARNIQGDFCDIYKPVYTSEEDTEETREQVDQNNVIYDECL